MAESSLTVPNVGAVVDFGMHRVNEYDDEERTFVCYARFFVQESEKLNIVTKEYKRLPCNMNMFKKQ